MKASLRSILDLSSLSFFSILVFSLGIFHVFSAFFVAVSSPNPPRDFVSCYYTARALFKMEPKVLYDFSIENGQPSLREEVEELKREMGYSEPLDLPSPYNPSFLISIMFPFFLLPLTLAGKLYTFLNLFLLLFIIYLFSRLITGSSVLFLSGLILLSHPVKSGILAGQSHFLLFLFVMLILILWERQSLSGILLGLTLLHKPFTAPILLYGILRKRWRFALYAILVLAIFLGIDVILWGRSILPVYLTYLKERALWTPNWIGAQSFLSILSGNVSYQGEFVRASGSLRILFFLFFLLVNLFSFLLIFRRRMGFLSDFNLLLTAGVLSSPVLYPQHFMTIFPVLLVFEKGKMGTLERILGAVGFSLIILPPERAAPALYNATHLFFGLLLLWFALVLYYVKKR